LKAVDAIFHGAGFIIAWRMDSSGALVVKSENRRLGGWPILSPTFTCQHNPKRGWNFIVSGMLFSPAGYCKNCAWRVGSVSPA